MSIRGLAAAALLILSGHVSQGADPGTVVRLEEDWEIQVASPDSFQDLPQIVTVFGPEDPEQGVHALFELNHGTLPEFAEGGMQLQYWSGETLKGYRSQKAPTELGTAGEILKFTTVTEIENGHLTLAVVRGESQTFGEFGDENALRIRVRTQLSNLDGMNLNNSISHSRVTYGANHVSRFRRNRVRMFNSGGDVVGTDTTVRYVQGSAN